MYSTVTISSPDGETEAKFVPDANLVCSSLRHRGAELLDPGRGIEAYAQRGKTMGIPLLHPWANRLAGLSYRVGAQTVNLPASEGRFATDPGGLPIHGALPGELRWTVAPDTAPDRLSARLDWRSSELLELFPFEHELTIDASLTAGTLSLTTTLQSTGDDRVPVSFGFHPYLRIADSPRGDWRVALGAGQRLVLDERMIPTGAREPLTERDFLLGEQSWDDGLAELDPGEPRFSVGDERTMVTVTFEEGFDYAQVYAPPGHDYICFEPMTAPTNALNSGEGLILVEPGDTYRTRWSVSVRP